MPPLLIEDEAVRLFADRARAVRRNFALDAANRELVAEVCRRLDGLPLAIELAVHWIEVLSPSELLPLLDRRFQILWGGARTAPERQQTLRAAVDWSYELLSPQERLLFQRLSVFAGGFTLAAVEHVCSDQDLPASDVVAHLAALCSSSMVEAAPPAAGQTRFRLLETLREYGQERLVEAGEADAFRDRHLSYYGGLAEAAFAARMGGGRRSVAEVLDWDRDNVREALAWGERRDPERTFVVAGTLVEDLRMSLLSFGEIRERLEQLRPRVTARTPGRAYALLAAGIMAFAAAADDEARQRYGESCDLFEALCAPGGEAWARIALGQLKWGIGDFAGASRELRAAERLHTELGNALGRHRARLRAAMAEMHDPALRPAARAALDEAIEQGPDLGDPFGAGLARAWRGMIDAMAGDLDGAGDHFRGAIPLLAKDPLVAVPLFGLALCWVDRDPQRAMRLLAAGDALQPRTGLPKPYALELIARECDRRARLAMDDALADAAFAEGRAMSRADALVLALSTVETPAAPTATDGGVGALTAREAQIARLVAEGLTNRQIAGTFTLSVRTVETHVDRCLTKLGFHSRARLASWVREQEAQSKDT